MKVTGSGEMWTGHALEELDKFCHFSEKFQYMPEPMNEISYISAANLEYSK